MLIEAVIWPAWRSGGYCRFLAACLHYLATSRPKQQKNKKITGNKETYSLDAKYMARSIFFVTTIWLWQMHCNVSIPGRYRNSSLSFCLRFTDKVNAPDLFLAPFYPDKSPIASNTLFVFQKLIKGREVYCIALQGNRAKLCDVVAYIVRSNLSMARSFIISSHYTPFLTFYWAPFFFFPPIYLLYCFSAISFNSLLILSHPLWPHK